MPCKYIVFKVFLDSALMLYSFLSLVLKLWAVLLMCTDQFSLLSMWRPRHLAWFTISIRVFPRQTSFRGPLNPFLDKIRISHFCGWMVSKFVEAYLSIFVRALCNLSITMSTELSVSCTVQSSAKSSTGETVWSRRLLTLMEKPLGPSSEPCGTPNLTSSGRM